MLRQLWRNYLQRHRNRTNQVLHLLGVPLTFVVSVAFLVQGHGSWALGAFFGGYLLQFVGHAIEGNDAGEVILIKKLLGRPYVEFGPLSKQSKLND